MANSGTEIVNNAAPDTSGEKVLQKYTEGGKHTRPYPSASDLETHDITIDGAADLFTDPTAPVAAELVTVTPVVSGKKHCRITWHNLAMPFDVAADSSDIPLASIGVATLNANDNANALARLTIVNLGVGAHTLDTGKRMFSAQNSQIEWDLTGTDGTVDRVDLGFIPPVPADTGVIPVYASVEIW